MFLVFFSLRTGQQNSARDVMFVSGCPALLSQPSSAKHHEHVAAAREDSGRERFVACVCVYVFVCSINRTVSFGSLPLVLRPLTAGFGSWCTKLTLATDYIPKMTIHVNFCLPSFLWLRCSVIFVIIDTTFINTMINILYHYHNHCWGGCLLDCSRFSMLKQDLTWILLCLQSMCS